MISKFLRNNRGAAAIEFALVALPVIFFIFGIMQTAWVVWSDNLLHVAVDAAARCAGVKSTTTPCNGADLISPANQVFAPLSGASFSNNSGCDGGVGLVGTYDVPILFIFNVTLMAKSCYPVIS
jgi:Flp pilus assembly protein TadG